MCRRGADLEAKFPCQYSVGNCGVYGADTDGILMSESVLFGHLKPDKLFFDRAFEKCVFLY